MPRRKILLAQLPIPPVCPEPVRQNVPLAAGYLKMYAEQQGLGEHYQIELLSPGEANTRSDQGLVEAILARDPWMVGFTCYLWNIVRTLWIAERLKERRPDVRIILGGPEITADNAWVLQHDAVDYAAIGEGEQTFAELLQALVDDDHVRRTIDGLYDAESMRDMARSGQLVIPFRKPLPNLNTVSSPYLAGILDAADEQVLLLETIRGCVFKCKFCYYPKSYNALYFVDESRIVANLEHARQRGAREVVLLDPTLNQRKHFDDFLRLLIRENPERQFTYFGELRAEGITAQTAQLLREANFTEVEVGLQSVDPLAMDLMDRKNNLRAFERGVRAMLDAGLDVKIDLIIGLPGDTVDSVRRGIDYLHDRGLYSRIQVFNLAVLPGTAFRQEAAQLGLRHQDRPPYYVLETPTLSLEQMYDLMDEAQDVFETEFDPLPPPVIHESWLRYVAAPDHNAHANVLATQTGVPKLQDFAYFDLDDSTTQDVTHLASAPAERAQAFTVWLRSADFDAHSARAAAVVRRLLVDNPHTTLQVVLDPGAEPHRLGAATFEVLLQEFYREPTYLDRFYSMSSGAPKGAKRLVVALPESRQTEVSDAWQDTVAEYASMAWLPQPCGVGEENPV